MKPSIAAVQSRLGIAPKPRHACDWRIKSGLHAGRGGTSSVTYRCALCGATKQVTVGARFKERERCSP